MKKFFLNLLLVASLLVGLNSHGAQVVSTVSTNATYNLLSAGAIATDITVASGAVATTIKFFDSSAATGTNILNPTYTNAAYTGYVTYTTNYTQLYTNRLGRIQTNTFTGIFKDDYSVAAATNTLTALYTVVVPANTTFQDEVNWNLARGMVVVATTNATVVVTYQSK